MLILLMCILRAWTSHPSRIGCKQVWWSSRWAVSTILRQEWDNLFHKSSWRLKQKENSLKIHDFHWLIQYTGLSLLTLQLDSPLQKSKCRSNSPFIIKVSLPHCLLKVRHSGLIKWGQSARRENKMIVKTFAKVWLAMSRETIRLFHPPTCWGNCGSGSWSRRQGRCPGRHGWWWWSHTGTE